MKKIITYIFFGAYYIQVFVREAIIHIAEPFVRFFLIIVFSLLPIAKRNFKKRGITMEENGTYRWAPPKEKKEPNWKKVKHTVLSVIVILVLLLLVSTCYYTVDDKQQAVVTTFGRVTDITDAALQPNNSLL